MSLHNRLAEGSQQLAPWQQTMVMLALVVIAAWLVIKVGLRYVDRAMHRSRHIDDTLRIFIRNTVRLGGWVVALVVVLNVAGIDTAALVGGLAIGGFILGFALKDTLGNLAAGVMLLFYRPFNVMDTVTIGGETGDVMALGMSMTTLKQADARIVTVPNAKVLGQPITNHTREPMRRADVMVGISYDDDIDAAVKGILEALQQDPRVLSDPAPSVRITELADSSVNLQVRPWVRTPDFWQAKADFHGVVKRAVEAAGCSIPYPQRDVHMSQV